MEKEIRNSVIDGEIKANPSKSHMQRVIAASFLSHGKTTIHNPDQSDDSLASLKLIEELGANISKNEVIQIESHGFNIRNSQISCGESGLGLRMFSPIIALSDEKITLLGKGSLKSRPIDFVSKTLKELGVDTKDNNGKVPLEIKGPLIGGKISLDASLTSQFLSGILMALPLLDKDSIVLVKNLKSRGYIDFTMDVLNSFGVDIKNERYQIFRIRGNQKYAPGDIWVESDWSGAAFMLVAAATCGKIRIKGMDIQSQQPDQKILEVLENVGANITFSMGSLIVQKRNLKPFEFDATDCPDLFPPLAALASSIEGTCAIKGTERLIHKESNRAQEIVKVLSDLGINARINNEKLIINGGKIGSGEIDSMGDHRIAMMAAILGLNSEKSVLIKNTEVVSKSYPNFFSDLDSLMIKN